MKHVSYNGLSLLLPEGWSDASIISLFGPEPPALSLVSTRAVLPERPNVVIRHQPLTRPGADLARLADAQEVMMAQLMDQLQVLGAGNIELDGSIPAAWREFSFSVPPRLIRQLQIYFVVDGRFYTMVGTATAGPRYQTEREHFFAIAASLRWSLSGAGGAASL